MPFPPPGIQEYVEAVSFQHFIQHRSLISLEEVNCRLVFLNGDTSEEKVGSVSRSVGCNPDTHISHDAVKPGDP